MSASADIVAISPGANLPSRKGAWERLPATKREQALKRKSLIDEVHALEAYGISRTRATEQLLAELTAKQLGVALTKLAMELGRNGTPPSRATVLKWLSDFDKGGISALASGHKGRALALYRLPSKPAMETVALWLVDEGFLEVSASRVRRYLKSLPANMGENNSGRLGAREYRNTQRNYIRRTTDGIPPGAIYQGDGHTVDVYVAHPNTGKIWRPELTAWMDVSSRVIVGWWLSEAESSQSTLFALSHAMIQQGHVPAMLHIDNGSGYKSKMMADESTGYYQRFGIEPMFALPYNAKAKGNIERWFGTMERDFGKKWPSYCGADMADEVLTKLARDVNTGKVQLPSLAEYAQSLTQWIERYHNTPHRGLDGKTPAEVWSALECTPLALEADAIVRPRKECSVRRETVRLHNREYSHHELIAYNNQRLTVEYDLHDDKTVRIIDQKGRWICDATLVGKKDYVPASRLEEAKQKREKAALARLEQKALETRRRAGLLVDHATHTDQIINDTPAPDALANNPNSSDTTIDILDIDY